MNDPSGSIMVLVCHLTALPSITPPSIEIRSVELFPHVYYDVSDMAEVTVSAQFCGGPSEASARKRSAPIAPSCAAGHLFGWLLVGFGIVVLMKDTTPT